MAKDVTVIIVNWNGAHLLRRCLSAVLAQTYPSYEVIVVDNASTDNSVELVQRDYPAVRLIQNRSNVGFASANNVGIAASQSKYVATLNNDTQAEPEWLAELQNADAIYADREAGGTETLAPAFSCHAEQL